MACNQCSPMSAGSFCSARSSQKPLTLWHTDHRARKTTGPPPCSNLRFCSDHVTAFYELMACFTYCVSLQSTFKPRLLFCATGSEKSSVRACLDNLNIRQHIYPSVMRRSSTKCFFSLKWSFSGRSEMLGSEVRANHRPSSLGRATPTATTCSNGSYPSANRGVASRMVSTEAPSLLVQTKYLRRLAEKTKPFHLGHTASKLQMHSYRAAEAILVHCCFIATRSCHMHSTSPPVREHQA